MRATSHIFSTMRGKVGGIVYLTTPNNQIIARQYAVPVNPMTSLQGKVRTFMSDAVDKWDSIGAEAREDWQLYAQANGGLSTNGRRLFIGGYVFMMQAQKNFIGGSNVVDPELSAPNTPGTGFIIANTLPLIAPLGDSGFRIEFTNNTPFDQNVALQISPMFGGARMRYQGPWDTTINEVIKVNASSSTVFVMVTQDQADTARFVKYRPFFQLRAAVPLENGDLIGAEEIIRVVNNIAVA